MRLMPAVLVIGMLMLAGCSASPAENTAPPAQQTQAAAPQQTQAPAVVDETLESVAATAGLDGFARSDAPAPGAIAWGQGTLDGKTVKVYEFATDDAFQSFVATVAGFGITEDSFVRYGKFAFAPNDQSQKDTIASKLG